MSIGTDYAWYAVTTRYKCEKHVAGALGRSGIQTYVPLLAKTKRYTRKIKRYQIPLISCYVFVFVSRREYVRVLETPHVVGFVKFENRIIPVRQEEIDILRRVVGEVQEVRAEPRTWIRGDSVEIISGNLTGLRGTLCEARGRHEFVVELESLGYQMRMTVDQRVLRKVQRAEALSPM